MNLFKRNLLATLLLACLAAPASVLAEDTPAAAMPMDEPTAALTPAATPAQRMELMQTLRGRMREIMQTQDADKRKELLEAQMKDLDALAEMGPPAGMGMGMMKGQGGMMGQGGKSDCKMGHGMGPGKGMGPGMGSGMGMMMGPGGKKDCMMGDCPRRDGAGDARLDALEKRLDMLQMMMQMMMRH